MKNVEIELKLLLGKRELKKLLASELLKGVLREGSEKKRNLVSSYYDTADFALKKNGIAYRVRDKGDGTFEATVKTDRKSNGGLSERVELNMPLAENVAVLEGFGELGLGYELTELAPDGVEKLFNVDVVRTTYLLDLDGAVAVPYDFPCPRRTGVLCTGCKTPVRRRRLGTWSSREGSNLKDRTALLQTRQIRDN